MPDLPHPGCEITPQFSQFMYVDQCLICFMLFAYPSVMYRRRHEDGKDYFCPNGHKQHWIIGPTPEEQAKKRAAIQKIHDEEQAEAKAADLSRPSATEPLLTPAAPPMPPELRSVVGGRVGCPHCDKSYKLHRGILKHLRLCHDVPEKQAVDMYLRFIDARRSKEVPLV